MIAAPSGAAETFFLTLRFKCAILKIYHAVVDTLYGLSGAMLGGTLSTIESISAETVKSNMNNTLSGPPQLIPFSI